MAKPTFKINFIAQRPKGYWGMEIDINMLGVCVNIDW